MRNDDLAAYRAIGPDAGRASRRLMAGLAKRSLSLAGHRTSLALEPDFWRVLEAMAAARSSSLAALVGDIDKGRGARPLASACRLAALAFAEQRAPTPAQ